MTYKISKYEPTALLHPKAPNFKQYEVGKSDYAARNDIDNTPSLEVLTNAAGLAVNCLQPIRDHFKIPISANSWYRGEAVERVMAKSGFESYCKKRGLPINEASWKQYFAIKQHPTGNAADIEIPGISNDELFEWCKKNLKFDQLIREFAKPGDPTSGWVHISWKETGNRQQVLHIG